MIKAYGVSRKAGVGYLKIISVSEKVEDMYSGNALDLERPTGL